MVCSICATIFSGERPVLWADVEDPLQETKTYSEIREREAAYFRPLHAEISEVCNGVLHGCQICDIVWRHFFKEITPRQFNSNPTFQRGRMVHSFSGSGTHYRLRKYELSGTEISEDTLEIEIGLNSRMDRNISEFKTIIVAPLEGMSSFFNLISISNKPRQGTPFSSVSADSWARSVFSSYLVNNTTVVYQMQRNPH